MYVVLETLIKLNEGKRLTRNFFSLRASFNAITAYIIRRFLNYIILITLKTDDTGKEKDLRFLTYIVSKRHVPRIFSYQRHARNIQNEVLTNKQTTYIY